MDKKYKCKFLPKAITGIDMKRLVCFYLLLSQIKTISVKIYFNNHYFHVLTFQVHYV